MKQTLLLTALLAALFGRPEAGAADRPKDFALDRLDGQGTIKLSDHAGTIVVLDFFAYWCQPCARSSPVVEERIQRFYASKKGNPQGHPVQVISINVEPNDTKRTRAFVEKHGLNLVLNDKEGSTLKSFGGEGLPYFVVLDGTQGTPEAPSFKVVYARAGFEGVDKLRSIIDRLGTKRP
jgi:peroxiredoxin